jgi:hypothetical protein
MMDDWVGIKRRLALQYGSRVVASVGWQGVGAVEYQTLRPTRLERHAAAEWCCARTLYSEFPSRTRVQPFGCCTSALRCVFVFVLVLVFVLAWVVCTWGICARTISMGCSGKNATQRLPGATENGDASKETRVYRKSTRYGESSQWHHALAFSESSMSHDDTGNYNYLSFRFDVWFTVLS